MDQMPIPTGAATLSFVAVPGKPVLSKGWGVNDPRINWRTTDWQAIRPFSVTTPATRPASVSTPRAAHPWRIVAPCRRAAAPEQQALEARAKAEKLKSEQKVQ